MIFDCHVHTYDLDHSYQDCLKQMDAAGIDKIMLLSHHPASFWKESKSHASPIQSLESVMEWSKASDRFIPFYWIDPLETDAFEQVEKAVAAGIVGFKVICNRHFPGDERPMQVFAKIAEAGKPILFHSGILYSSSPSSMYNRPSMFEPLFYIPNLRFAMAHVSWPWHDECLAVYGHWQNSKDAGEITSEMFIDTTPGTPRIYREEVLRKIYTIGYDIENNVVFGTDCDSNYNTEYALEILAMDKEALDAIGVTPAQREKYYSKNLMRFLGR